MAGLTDWPLRRYYAHLLVCRLILIQTLQQRGFLPGGDRWYVQTRLGHCQDQGRDRCFQQLILPLCLQGLGLPPPERSPALIEAWGPLPYLGGSLFEPRPWEASVHIPDDPWEDLLAWLAEQTWPGTPGPESPGLEPLGPQSLGTEAAPDWAVVFELWLATDKAPLWPSVTVHRRVQQAIAQALHQQLEKLIAVPSASLPQLEGDWASLLAAISTPQTIDAGGLLHQGVPALGVLDPACGSGRLLAAALPPLQQLYQTLGHCAQTHQEEAFQIWQQQLPPAPTAAWALTAAILTRHLYGVDLRPEAIAVSQCQLYLALLATTTPAQGLAPLPTLGFNCLTGNALVGLIRVDEASFDQALAPTAPPATAIPIQGDLLQPLAAENYRTLLQEKQIRIEHYRAQTQALGETTTIPSYAQAAFLRDRIEALNQTAQAKLNHLLLDELSRRLGLRVRSPHPSGRPRRRPLTVADIAALHPLHWGFHFSQRFQQWGGFAVILCQPPPGTLRPQGDRFYADHVPLFADLGIKAKAFRKQRQVLLQQFPDLAAAWATHASPYFLLGDYLRRSHHYRPLEPSHRGRLPRALYQAPLFQRRCADLLAPQGILLLFTGNPVDN